MSHSGSCGIEGLWFVNPLYILLLGTVVFRSIFDPPLVAAPDLAHKGPRYNGTAKASHFAISGLNRRSLRSRSLAGGTSQFEKTRLILKDLGLCFGILGVKLKCCAALAVRYNLKACCLHSGFWHHSIMALIRDRTRKVASSAAPHWVGRQQ